MAGEVICDSSNWCSAVLATIAVTGPLISKSLDSLTTASDDWAILLALFLQWPSFGLIARTHMARYR